MSEEIKIDKLLLQKFAQFTKLVMGELSSLRSQLSTQMQKEASNDTVKQIYQDSVVKIAGYLHNSDFDFVVGGDTKKFVKKACDNPYLLAEAFGKICEAADVTLIGRPARVTTTKKIANYDPVYAKAFGLYPEGTITDLE